MPPSPSSSRLTLGFRGVAVVLGITPLLLLAVAGRLQPSPSGMGTHQQLGLPPCTLRVLAGIRCPACGMTTSWSHFARGDWGHSLRAQPGGFLLALFSLPWAAVVTRAGVVGTIPGRRTQRMMGTALVTIGAVVLLHWVGSF